MLAEHNEDCAGRYMLCIKDAALPAVQVWHGYRHAKGSGEWEIQLPVITATGEGPNPSCRVLSRLPA